MEILNRSCKVLLCCYVLLGSVAAFAQVAPVKIVAFSEIRQAVLTKQLERSLGKAALIQLTPPALTPTISFHHGKRVTILPKTAIAEQVKFFEKNHLPLSSLHHYITGLQPYFDNRENFFEVLAINFCPPFPGTTLISKILLTYG